jgi:hypothetical protein
MLAKSAPSWVTSTAGAVVVVELDGADVELDDELELPHAAAVTASARAATPTTVGRPFK